MYFDWSFAVVQFVRLWLTMRSSWWIPYTRNGSPKPRPRWRRGCVTLFWVIKICPPSRKFQLIPSQLSDLFTTKPWRWPEIAYKSRKTNWSPQGKRFSLQKLLPNLPRRAPLSFITWKRKLGGRFTKIFVLNFFISMEGIKGFQEICWISCEISILCTYSYILKIRMALRNKSILKINLDSRLYCAFTNILNIRTLQYR